MKPLRRVTWPERKVGTVSCLNDYIFAYGNLNHKAIEAVTFLFVYKQNLQYAAALMGYGDKEDQTTVLELTYHYGARKYVKGNAYSHVSDQ